MKTASTFVEALDKEHQGAEEVLAELERAAERLARREEVRPSLVAVDSALAFFKQGLQNHFRREEEGVFPALSQVIGPAGPVQAMLSEHRSFWMAVDSLEEARYRFEKGDDGELERSVRHVVWLLRGHIERETKVLFPLLAQHLGLRELSQVEQAWKGLEDPS